MSRRVQILCVCAFVLSATGAFAQLSKPTLTNVATKEGKMLVDYTPISGATSYQVDFFDKATNTLLKSVPSGTTRTEILPGLLPPNRLVDVKVKAVNSQTASAPSDPVATVTAPVTPSGITTMPGLNKNTVSWQTAAGSMAYQLTCSNGASFKPASNPQIVPGLTAGKIYNCMIWAYNASGVESAPATFTIKAANIAMD